MKKYEIYNNSNKKSPNTKKQRNTNMSYQTLSAFKKSNTKKEKYQINCSSQTIDRKDLKKNNNINNENEEEFSIIQSLWDDLGVYLDYQEEFRNYIYKIKDEEQKNEILNLEKENLRKYREALLKLSIEISNRENNIFKIKKYCKELDKYSLDKDNQELPSDLFENIQKVIKYYRINTVNVINKIMKLREISSYFELSKKWDPSQANRSYLYNKNYILLMFNDIKFINNSILFNFLETDNQINKTDLFLSNCKNLITNNGTKIKIPISLELQGAINKCKYIILQDTLFNKIKKEKKFLKQRNFFTPKTIKVENAKPKKSTSEISLVNDKGEKKYYEMFGHNKVNLSRTLYYLKRTMGNDYEKMFFNAQNNKNSDKKNMETMNKYFTFKPNNNNDINQINQYKNNDIKVQYSEGENTKNKNENNLLEQNKKNNEDIQFLSNKSNNNKTNSENINNIENNLENTTHKENKINEQNNTPKKEELNIDNNEDSLSPIKKGNKELNNEEIKENNEELNNEENQNINIEQNNNQIENELNNKKENEINENNNNNFNNDFHEEKLEEENNEEKNEIQNNNNIEKSISNNNKLEVSSEMNEKIEDKEKEKLNESNKEIIKEEENNDNKDNNLNEEENKKIKTNESIEENDKKIENEIKEEKVNNDIINNDNDIKNKEQDELEEKNIDEDNKKNTEIKEEKNINEEKKEEEENYEGEGQFEEITQVDKNKVISDGTDKENLNKSKEKEESKPKVKLLQYRQYSEEEIKKINKDDEDDDEFFVDYKNI